MNTSPNHVDKLTLDDCYQSLLDLTNLQNKLLAEDDWQKISELECSKQNIVTHLQSLDIKVLNDVQRNMIQDILTLQHHLQTSVESQRSALSVEIHNHQQLVTRHKAYQDNSG